MMTVGKQTAYEESLSHARAGIALPVCACIRLTRQCNLTCEYCSETRFMGRDLSDEKWVQAIEMIHALGNRDITITGGEPFLRPFVPTLVRHATQRDMFVSVATNGLKLTDRLLATLDSAGLDWLSISIDRLDASPGGFGKALLPALDEILSHISTNKYAFGAVISAVVSQHNFLQLPQMAQYFTEKGIGLKLMLMMPNYVNPCRTEFSRITCFPEFEETIEQLKAMKKQGYMIHDSIEVFDRMLAYVRGDAIFRCHGGLHELSVNNDGRLVQCPDGTLSDVSVFHLESTSDYRAFVESTRDHTFQCGGCFWTCKQRLRDALCAL